MPRRSFFNSFGQVQIPIKRERCTFAEMLCWIAVLRIWLVAKRPHTYRYAAAYSFLPPFSTVNLYCTTIYNKSQAKNGFICFFAVIIQKCSRSFSENYTLSCVLLLTILPKYIIINNWYRLRFYRLFQSFMPCLE